MLCESFRRLHAEQRIIHRNIELNVPANYQHLVLMLFDTNRAGSFSIGPDDNLCHWVLGSKADSFTAIDFFLTQLLNDKVRTIL